jgi:two-component system, NtrC family, response regulator AtoC
MRNEPTTSPTVAGALEPVRVLIVDDDDVLARALQRVLVLQGFAVDAALDGRAALNRLEKNDYDVMLLDLRMSGMDGMEVYSRCRAGLAPATIIHSAHIDVQTAVKATRAGVHDVMQKPVPEDVLAARIRELALQRRNAGSRPRSATSGVSAQQALLPLVGSSPQNAELCEQIRRVAQFRDVSVLIQGPTGTGKELVAQGIHALTCPDEPFVSINCAAVPEQLFESELFGHEAGSFTSAKAPRVGLLEESGCGTLFLDEVGEMPIGLQAKLLRVLEIRQFRRVGGTRTRVLGARVISATNRPLNSTLSGSMRQDLFFRLSGYAIRTPALSERIADIPELVAHFLAQFGEKHRVGSMPLSPEAQVALSEHSWPGNVRELRAVVENASIVARGGVIQREDVELALRARVSSPSDVVPADSQHPASVPRSRKTVRSTTLPNLQREVILRAFEESQQNLSRTALDLGIPRSTLRARLKRYGAR